MLALAVSPTEDLELNAPLISKRFTAAAAHQRDDQLPVDISTNAMAGPEVSYETLDRTIDLLAPFTFIRHLSRAPINARLKLHSKQRPSGPSGG
jgi:hypothetical protein